MPLQIHALMENPSEFNCAFMNAAENHMATRIHAPAIFEELLSRFALSSKWILAQLLDGFLQEHLIPAELDLTPGLQSEIENARQIGFSVTRKLVGKSPDHLPLWRAEASRAIS